MGMFVLTSNVPIFISIATCTLRGWFYLQISVIKLFPNKVGILQSPYPSVDGTRHPETWERGSSIFCSYNRCCYFASPWQDVHGCDTGGTRFVLDRNEFDNLFGLIIVHFSFGVERSIRELTNQLRLAVPSMLIVRVVTNDPSQACTVTFLV